MTEAVLDAGPLIYLAKLDALDVLWDFSSMIVPEAVWIEVEHHAPVAMVSGDHQYIRCCASWETFKSRRSQQIMRCKLQMAAGLAGNTTHSLSVVSRTLWHFARQTEIINGCTCPQTSVHQGC